MTSAIGHLNHFGPATDDFDRTCFLYEHVLKLTPMEVPAIGYGFQVAWFKDENGLQVHVTGKDEDFSRKTGLAFNRTLHHHVAYKVNDYAEAKRALDENGFEYHEAETEGVLSRRQLYVVEPSGLVVELFVERTAAQ